MCINLKYKKTCVNIITYDKCAQEEHGGGSRRELCLQEEQSLCRRLNVALMIKTKILIIM